MLPEQMDPDPTSTGHGLSGTLRLLAMVLIAGLATFAVLGVLGVLPQGLLQDYAGKTVAVAAIVGVAIAVIALVLRTGRGGR
jgi:hypothetical protein